MHARQSICHKMYSIASTHKFHHTEVMLACTLYNTYGRPYTIEGTYVGQTVEGNVARET